MVWPDLLCANRFEIPLAVSALHMYVDMLHPASVGPSCTVRKAPKPDGTRIAGSGLGCRKTRAFQGYEARPGLGGPAPQGCRRSSHVRLNSAVPDRAGLTLGGDHPIWGNASALYEYRWFSASCTSNDSEQLGPSALSRLSLATRPVRLDVIIRSNEARRNCAFQNVCSCGGMNSW